MIFTMNNKSIYLLALGFLSIFIQKNILGKRDLFMMILNKLLIKKLNKKI